jgi:ATPase subunit of ABC transporter with duplicated ATPase domains
MGHLHEEFRLKGGYSMEAEVGNVLAGLGFSPPDWERECGEFSGGWQMRIALARLLLKKPNVLLLDEPTNHLDIEARNWLEEYLKLYPFSVILVSHDRFFLDQVCHRIVEVWNQDLYDYHCSYSDYLVRREERVLALRDNTVHLTTLIWFSIIIRIVCIRSLGRRGYPLIFLFTPRGLRRDLLDTTRSSRISLKTAS